MQEEILRIFMTSLTNIKKVLHYHDKKRKKRIQSMSNVETFREIVDNKVKNVATRFGVKNFDKNKQIGEYRELNFEDVLVLFNQFEITFSLPQSTIVNAVYKRKKEPKNFDYFDDMTFEDVTNIIRNKIGLSRMAAHNMQTLINYKKQIEK